MTSIAIVINCFCNQDFYPETMFKFAQIRKNGSCCLSNGFLNYYVRVVCSQ